MVGTARGSPARLLSYGGLSSLLARLWRRRTLPGGLRGSYEVCRLAISVAPCGRLWRSGKFQVHRRCVGLWLPWPTCLQLRRGRVVSCPGVARAGRRLAQAGCCHCFHTFSSTAREPSLVEWLSLANHVAISCKLRWP